MRMLDFVRANRLAVHAGEDDRSPPAERRAAAGAPARRRRAAGPSTGRSRARSASAASCASRGGRPADRRGRAGRDSAPPSTAPPRASTRSSSRAPRSAARPARRAGSRTTSASRPGSPAPSSPAAPSPRRGSSARARRRRTARSRSSRATAATSCSLEEDHEIAARAVVLATGAEYRRLPVDDLADYEGLSVFYAAGPPEAQLCGASRVAVVGGGTRPARPRSGSRAAARSSRCFTAARDLRETMSDYLIHELDRYGVVVRDRSEIAELHGNDGQLDAVTLKDGERLPLLLPVPLPRRAALHRVARRRRRARRRTASSSPATQPARSICSRRAFPASSRPATSAPARPSGARRRSAKARWRSSSSTNISRPGRERGERNLHASRSGHVGRVARLGRRL